MKKLSLSKEQMELMKFRVDMVRNKLQSEGEWESNARNMFDLYKGLHWPVELGDELHDRLTINYAQINVDVAEASIAYTDPEFLLEATESIAKENESYQKAALNSVWHEINALEPIQAAVQDSLICGKGVVFVGWRFQRFKSLPVEGARSREKTQPLPSASQQLPASPSGIENVPELGALPSGGALPGVPGEATGFPLPGTPGVPGGAEPLASPPVQQKEVAAQEMPEMESSVVYDNPIVRRVNPLQFHVDPDHDDLKNLMDAAYVIEECVLPLNDVVFDKKLQHTSKLQGSETIDDRYLSEKNRNSSFARRVRLYHYWQREGRIHAIIADELPNEPLLIEEWPYNFNTYPYLCKIHRRIPNEQDPQGQVEPAETSIQELDVYRSTQLRHDRRWAKGQIAYDKSLVDEEAIADLESGIDGAIVGINGPPAQAFGPVPTDPLPSEFYVTQVGIKSDISALMGVDEWQTGTPADRTRRTRGEVELLISRSSIRGQKLLRDFERFCEKVASLILTLLQDPRFCDRERWIEITGEDGGTQPGSWNAERVKGSAHVRVVCNSSRVQTPETMQNKWGFLLQSIAPYVGAGVIDPTVLLEEAAKAYGLTPPQIKRMSPQGGNGSQVQEAVQLLAKGLMEVKQQVEQLTAQLQQNQVDAKTQMDVAKHQQQMQQKAESHGMKMQTNKLKMAQIMADMQNKALASDEQSKMNALSTGVKIINDRRKAEVQAEGARQTNEAKRKAIEETARASGEERKRKAKEGNSKSDRTGKK